MPTSAPVWNLQDRCLRGTAHTNLGSTRYSSARGEAAQVDNFIRDRWVFDAGSDCEKCPRSTSSTSYGSEVDNTIPDRWVFDAVPDYETCPRLTSSTSTSCGSEAAYSSCSSSDESDMPHTNSGVWPSAGSVGHPHCCAAPCKFAGKNTCKDGASCTRCHLCTWTRAKYRERAGAHRTMEMLSV